MERGVTKLEILTSLCRSPHSALNEYVPLTVRAAVDEPEFLAHLIAWDAKKGNIRDAHIALPVISLAKLTEPEFVDNSLAHLAMLSPRELRTAVMFSRGYIRNKDMVPNPDLEKRKRWPQVRVGGWKRFYTAGNFLNASRRKKLDATVSRYLRHREANAALFERTMVQFRRDLISLYELSHTPMSEYAKTIIIDKVRPMDSALLAIKDLGRMQPREAAAAIVEYKLPFLMLPTILGDKVKDPILLMAIIDRMTPAELQTNMKYLERMGVKDNAETRVALENGLRRMVTQTRHTGLKTTKAAEAVTDQALKSKLAEVQEKQIASMKGADGNWLVVADCSGSMHAAIVAAREIAATLARFVKGQVAMVFCNVSPRWFDVTGKTLAEITTITRHVTANGGTSLGCGIAAALDRNFDIHGIAVVSDGGENAVPWFAAEYARANKKLDRVIPVYFYKLDGDPDGLTGNMSRAGFDMQVHDLRRMRVDSYSVTNMVQTMRVNKYSVLDEVMESRLLTLDAVLAGKGVTHGPLAVEAV